MSSPIHEFVEANEIKDGNIEMVLKPEGGEAFKILIRAKDRYSLARECADLADSILCDGYCHQDRD